MLEDERRPDRLLETLQTFSMADEDDYIANLLKVDAKKSSLRYAQVGLAGLLPKKYVR
jgi:hypothetical protein